jgi:hypothetical protein
MFYEYMNGIAEDPMMCAGEKNSLQLNHSFIS